jgi:hypothetical protein
MYHGHGKSFWEHPMVLLGDVCQVKARFGLFGDSVNLAARLVYDAKCTTGMEIFSAIPDGTSSFIGQVEGHFGPFEIV